MLRYKSAPMPSDCGFHSSQRPPKKCGAQKSAAKGNRNACASHAPQVGREGRKLTAWGEERGAVGAAGGWSRRGGATAAWRPRASSRAPGAWRRRTGGENSRGARASPRRRVPAGMGGGGRRGGVSGGPERRSGGERWGFRGLCRGAGGSEGGGGHQRGEVPVAHVSRGSAHARFP